MKTISSLLLFGTVALAGASPARAALLDVQPGGFVGAFVDVVPVATASQHNVTSFTDSGTTSYAINPITSSLQYAFANDNESASFSGISSASIIDDTRAGNNVHLYFTLNETASFSFSSTVAAILAPTATANYGTQLINYTAGIGNIWTGNSFNSGLLQPGSYAFIFSSVVDNRHNVGNASVTGNWRFTLSSLGTAEDLNALSTPDSASTFALLAGAALALFALGRRSLGARTS